MAPGEEVDVTTGEQERAPGVESERGRLTALGRRALIAVLVLAGGLRVVHLANHLGHGLNDFESTWTDSDMNAFMVWAERIVEGDLFSADTYHPYPDYMSGVAPLETFEEWWGGRTVFHQTPLYAYLLALSIWITGGKVLLLLAQIALSTLAVYLIYRLGSRMVDERSGLLAAALAATYAPWIVYDATLLRASLGASVTVVSIWLLLRVRDSGRAAVAFGTGAVLAAGVLLRPVALALWLGALLLWIDARSRASWKRWAPALAAGAILVLAPVVARNAAVDAPLLSFSTRGPETIAHGNHIGADPGFLSLPNTADYRRIMEEGHESAAGALVASIRTWPEDGRIGWWLGLEGRKLHAAFRDYEYADNVNFYFFRQETPGLALLPTFGLLVGLALVGVGLTVRRGRDPLAASLVLLAAASTLAMMLLTFASGRYRLPLAVLATLPAGVTLSALVDWVRRERWLRVGLCMVGVGLISAASYWTVPGRILFDVEDGAHRMQASDSRLLERLAALRAQEFVREIRNRRERGDEDSARALGLDYLAEIRRTIADTPPPASRNVRRTVINETYVMLEWARDVFVDEGLVDLAQAVDRELEWIRENT